MSSSAKGKILWADDEINFLESHILFLRDKGYDVTPVNSGEDAISISKSNNFDLVLLDEMMTGIDGLETLKHIKRTQPDIPVIMITKNEEEWLMDEAIASHISNYLLKPVSPNQIFMACKNLIEKTSIVNTHFTKDYLSTFQTLNEKIDTSKSLNDWFDICDLLCDWIVKFDKSKANDIQPIFFEQLINANHRFTEFISNGYKEIINSRATKTKLTPHTIENKIYPCLENDEKVILIIVDCLRADQWKAMTHILNRSFRIKTDYQMSLLPSATFYSRNAIFSGMYPLDLFHSDPDLYMKMLSNPKYYNRFEPDLLRSNLDKSGFSNVNTKYIKVSNYEYGSSLLRTMKNYKNVDLISMVVNFVDILGHSSSESDALREVLVDESAYRDIICSWTENSWFNDIIMEFKSWNRKIIITSDHGSTFVEKPIKIKAYKSASPGVRYKNGKNLNTKEKSALRIANPEDYRLPSTELNENYIIAKDDYYFVYPNNYSSYVKKLNGSFQHGGISLFELIVPLATLVPK